MTAQGWGGRQYALLSSSGFERARRGVSKGTWVMPVNDQIASGIGNTKVE